MKKKTFLRRQSDYFSPNVFYDKLKLEVVSLNIKTVKKIKFLLVYVN